MRITYSAAASLDGFIAKEDGDVAWLDDMSIDMKETGLEEFFASIDGLVMGRGTYDFVFEYGAWPYENKPTWVCTHRELERLDGANLQVVDSIEAVIPEAQALGLEHLWLVGGGRLASSFLQKGWLTHLAISVMPIKLGTGIPLFAEHQLEEIPAEKQEVIQKSGFKQMEMLLRSEIAT